MNVNKALKICEESQHGSNKQLAWITEKALSLAKSQECAEDLIAEKEMLNILDFLQSFLVKTKGTVTVFVDGSCVNNGRTGARAAYAIYVCSGVVDIMKKAHVLDIAEPQTNQRAELRGMWAALQYCESFTETATIYTDSMYTVNCLMVWGADWSARSWRKSDGKPVLHTDILIPMYDCLKRIEHRIEIKYVEAHTNGADFVSRGNAVVDKLAREAAQGASGDASSNSTVSNALSIQA